MQVGLMQRPCGKAGRSQGCNDYRFLLCAGPPGEMVQSSAEGTRDRLLLPIEEWLTDPDSPASPGESSFETASPLRVFSEHQSDKG